MKTKLLQLLAGWLLLPPPLLSFPLFLLVPQLPRQHILLQQYKYCFCFATIAHLTRQNLQKKQTQQQRKEEK